MDIVPTILETTKEGFAFQFRRLVPYFRTFQIDVADMDYAGHTTLDMPGIEQAFSSLPPRLLDGVSFDFHLMTKAYEQKMDYCRALSKKITVTNILIHHNLSPDYAALTSRFPEYTLGAVINSEDKLTSEKPGSPLFSLPIIQIMTVNIGAQGNPFIPESLLKIEQLRKMGYSGKIYIDGGVGTTSLPRIFSLSRLPDVLCVGSYLTHSEKLAQDAESLFDLLRKKESE